MKDVLDELAAARRTMGAATLPAGDAYTIELRRCYDAPVEDVWNAITDPERLGRWLKPVTGNLRLGGSFELDGGEHGEILRCDPPQRLRVSWLFGPEADEWPGTSELEVLLSPSPAGGTEFELVHAAAAGEPMFPTYGPGAGGVGWDLHLLTLAREAGPNTTLWESENEFRFDRLLMRLVALLMPGSFRKQSRQHMQDFKAFAEQGTDVRQRPN